MPDRMDGIPPNRCGPRVLRDGKRCRGPAIETEGVERMPRTKGELVMAACWCVPLCVCLHAMGAEPLESAAMGLTHSTPGAVQDAGDATGPAVAESAGGGPTEGIVRIRGGSHPAFAVRPVAFEKGGCADSGGCTVPPAARARGIEGKDAAACGSGGAAGNEASRPRAISYPPTIRPATRPGAEAACPPSPAVAAHGCPPSAAGGASSAYCPPALAHAHPYLLTTGEIENQLKYYKWRTKAFLDTHADPGAEGGWFAAKCWLKDQWAMYLARNRIQSAAFNAKLHAKLAYFVPSGCGGAGCPPVGFYSLVYPANPYYIDRRDTQVYANPVTGIPMVVPLPPNVEHVMHYSDDTPSSRLTRLGYRVYPR
ncbi:MAG: hypothetical protein D6725_02640 [Planctomycetota bacterium]|nr:MAG: hypothetical protein D6725_02640 [Planctomycetota bacterium]